MRLYHFCCKHSARAISADGLLRPLIEWGRLDGRLQKVGAPRTGLADAPAVVWLTDMAQPDRYALGLTSFTLSCDRTEFRFTVDTNFAEPWADYYRRWRANRDWLAWLHSGPVQPDRWYVAIVNLPYAERRARIGVVRR